MKMRVRMLGRERYREPETENTSSVHQCEDTKSERARARERESERARARESKRARERESERARERESERAGEWESKRARERASERARERASERVRERESKRGRERERTCHPPCVGTWEREGKKEPIVGRLWTRYHREWESEREGVKVTD